jgi:3-hydroxybutyryl-CoA dehydrogenase
MSNYLVIVSKTHPLLSKIKESGIRFLQFETDELFDLRKVQYIDCEAIFDFTVLPRGKKLSLLRNLSLAYDFPIISDLSTSWCGQFYQQIVSLKGTMATAFPSKNDTYEVHAEKNLQKFVEELFTSIGIKAQNISKPNFGFTYPRVVSMIINEAYFMYGENSADKESIDLAMKFGVNYPYGPFEWSEIIGKKLIVETLDELFNLTKEERYKVAPSLRLESLG